MRSHLRSWSATAALCLASAPALAADGALEINATCALIGCFAGDAPLLPVTITGAAGASRFLLTSDLEASGANTHVIQITANDVSLDLGGFRIHGANTCDTSGVCTVVGTGSGVSSTASDVEVRHGSVVGMPREGVALGPRGVVRELRASQNGVAGIATGPGGRVTDSIANQNGISGILAGPGSAVAGSTVTACTVFGNGNFGINAGSGSTITGSTASFNGARGGAGGGVGILAERGSTVTGSTAFQNTGSGIVVGMGAKVSGSTASFNTAIGIRTGAGSLVTGSSAAENGTGLSLGDDAAYRESFITRNTTALVVINGAGTFQNLGANHCADAASTLVPCP